MPCSSIRQTWYVGFVLSEREIWFIPAINGWSMSPVGMETGAAASGSDTSPKVRYIFVTLLWAIPMSQEPICIVQFTSSRHLDSKYS